jgi:hypothetical protein
MWSKSVHPTQFTKIKGRKKILFSHTYDYGHMKISDTRHFIYGSSAERGSLN